MAEPRALAPRSQWEAIGESFHHTRRHPWRPVTEWAARRLPPGARVLDLACGNGRHGAALRAEGREVVGADFSRPLVARAREAGLEAVVADATALPFPANSFGGGLFIAAVHCIPGRHHRVAALAELARALEPGAPALVSAWALWQDRWLRENLERLPFALLGRVDLHERWVDWRRDDLHVSRYYHLYTRRELREDLRAAGFRDVRVWGERLTKSRLPDNWFAEAVAP